jgi:hypothetical protein
MGIGHINWQQKRISKQQQKNVAQSRSARKNIKSNDEIPTQTSCINQTSYCNNNL